MNRYYIPHELKIGDVTRLSDKDSVLAISEGISIEDPVVLETYSSIFNAVVSYIEKGSVEVEVVEYVGKRETLGNNSKVPRENEISILQSISSPKKFGYFLEKCVEIGVSKVVPILSELSLVSSVKFEKDLGLYSKIISDATEQSRNLHPTVLEKVTNVKDISRVVMGNSIKVCLATEVPNTETLSKYIGNNLNKFKSSPITIAIGPESGWGVRDIENFKSQGFIFLHLEGNILRTETVGIVISSIIKFVKGII